MDANKAPNFPTYSTRTTAEKRRKRLKKLERLKKDDFFKKSSQSLPNIEKKIINPAEIWITLRLPTRVLPRSPTFSLSIVIGNKAQIFKSSNGTKNIGLIIY